MFRTLAFAAAVLPALAAPSLAAPPCNERASVLELLTGKYAERPVAIGMANNGGVVEVLSRADGRTWSIIITLPNGMSCMLAAGEEWETLHRTKTGPET